MCGLDTRHLDLATGCEALLTSDSDLVTCSALLDLVSRSWLEKLAEQCLQHRAAVLFALSFDGRIGCVPEEAEDRAFRELVNRHQRSDKGFGPALGPAASETAARCFRGSGYQVETAPSDWRLTPDMNALQERVIEGWSEAAIAMEPARRTEVHSWRARRLAHVAAGRSELLVGHQDLAAWLP
jgi:hypothetical protein